MQKIDTFFSGECQRVEQTNPFVMIKIICFPGFIDQMFDQDGAQLSSDDFINIINKKVA